MKNYSLKNKARSLVMAVVMLGSGSLGLIPNESKAQNHEFQWYENYQLYELYYTYYAHWGQPYEYVYLGHCIPFLYCYYAAYVGDKAAKCGPEHCYYSGYAAETSYYNYYLYVSGYFWCTYRGGHPFDITPHRVIDFPHDPSTWQGRWRRPAG